MKKITGLSILFFLLSIVTFAQDSVVIDKEATENWFEQNWMWVVGAVILIILIAALSGGSRDRKKITTTTVSEDNYGNIKKVTTEESEL